LSPASLESYVKIEGIIFSRVSAAAFITSTLLPMANDGMVEEEEFRINFVQARMGLELLRDRIRGTREARVASFSS